MNSHRLLLLLIVILSPWVGLNSAQAQETFGNFGIPTPAQRFSEEGREQLEREIRRLQDPPALEDRLTIDEEVDIQEDLLYLEDPRFHPEPLPLMHSAKTGESLSLPH